MQESRSKPQSKQWMTHTSTFPRLRCFPSCRSFKKSWGWNMCSAILLFFVKQQSGVSILGQKAFRAMYSQWKFPNSIIPVNRHRRLRCTSPPARIHSAVQRNDVTSRGCVGAIMYITSRNRTQRQQQQRHAAKWTMAVDWYDWVRKLSLWIHGSKRLLTKNWYTRLLFNEEK